MQVQHIENSWETLLPSDLIKELDSTVFLRRCRENTVTREELRTFVVQQYYYSKHFTRLLCALLSNISNEEDRLALTENLLEEIGFGESDAIPHSEIYRQMMKKMGIEPNESMVLSSTEQLIETLYRLSRDPNPIVGLAALCLGAEAIVPHLYSQIVVGFLGVGEPKENLEFFTIHIGCDDAHAETMKQIIDRELQRSPLQAEYMVRAAREAIRARVTFFEGLSLPTEILRRPDASIQSIQLSGLR